MNKRKQGTTTEVAESYTLSRIGEPDGEFKPLYIATVRGGSSPSDNLLRSRRPRPRQMRTSLTT